MNGEKFAGFCYIETFGDKNFVVHSGLIVHPDFRNQGLAKKIKTRVFKYSQEKYPKLKDLWDYHRFGGDEDQLRVRL